jgi:hypothetical protein
LLHVSEPTGFAPGISRYFANEAMFSVFVVAIKEGMQRSTTRKKMTDTNDLEE